MENPTNSHPPEDTGVPPPATGSAPWVALVGYPRNSLVGQYLEGPRDAKPVKRHGYGFTTDPTKAWPFPSEKQAKAKALIVDRHMGWGEGVMVTGPLADEMQNTEAREPEPSGPARNGGTQSGSL